MKQGDALLYQQALPGKLLAPYVDRFWLLKGPAHLLPERERRTADAGADLVFTFAGAYKHAPADGQAETPTLRGSAVLGQRSRGYVVEPAGATHSVAIRFRPGGLAAFTSLPMHELTDQAVDLDSIWGPVVADWEERLFTAPSLAHAAALLTHFLCARLEERPNLRAIQAAVQRIDIAGGNVSIRALADDFGWSQKHLERLFAQHVGLTPKHYARIARFRRLSCYAARPHYRQSLGLLAADCDQPGGRHAARILLTCVPRLWRRSLASAGMPQSAALIQSAKTCRVFTRQRPSPLGTLWVGVHPTRSTPEERKALS
jgi:AraC-like DNA-binding protein